MKRLINFNPDGLRGLHFFVEGLNFPIVIGTYSNWEETQVSYLANNIKKSSWDTEDVCRWCMSHQIQYQIVYPIRKRSVVRYPYKYYKFLQLKQELKSNC